MTRHLHALTVLLALAIAPAAAHAQAETSSFVQHEGGITGFDGTCEGESAIVTDGTIGQVIHTTDNANGSHLVVQLVFRTPGTGEVTGNRYLSMSNVHFVLNMGAATTSRSGGHTLMLAPGPGDDASLQTVFHTTTNANGEQSFVELVRSEECG